MNISLSLSQCCTNWITLVVWIPSSRVLENGSQHSNHSALCRKIYTLTIQTGSLTSVLLYSFQNSLSASITVSLDKGSQTWAAGFQTGNVTPPPSWQDSTLNQQSSVCGPVPHGSCFQVFGAVINRQKQGSWPSVEPGNNRHHKRNDRVQVIQQDAKCRRKRKQKLRPGPVIMGLEGWL